MIFDNSLTPSQQRNLQNQLEVPVWDRTNLILEIFDRRARTKEARLQVESANLQYLLPRLVGMRDALSRQGGGAGAGGGARCPAVVFPTRVPVKRSWSSTAEGLKSVSAS